MTTCSALLNCTGSKSPYPDNARSIRVVEKLGFAEIGLAPSYLHIAGQWRDHVVYQLVADDVDGRVIDRLTGSAG